MTSPVLSPAAPYPWSQTPRRRRAGLALLAGLLALSACSSGGGGTGGDPATAATTATTAQATQATQTAELSPTTEGAPVPTQAEGAPLGAASAPATGGVAGAPVAPAGYTYPGYEGVYFITASLNTVCAIGYVTDPDNVSFFTDLEEDRADEVTVSCRLVDSPPIKAQDAQDCGPITNAPGVIWSNSTGHGYGDCRGGIDGLTFWAQKGSPWDEVYHENLVLPYGSSLSYQGGTCGVTQDGVTCAGPDGHGFFVGRSDYRFF